MGRKGDSQGIVQELKNLTIRTNGICGTQNQFWRMKHTNFSGIVRYKEIT